jgi:PAS domain S-box-containing protein
MTGCKGAEAMPELLHLLLVQPAIDDPQPILFSLREAGYALDWHQVETEREFLAALKPPPDLILCDYHLPRWSGLAALNRLRERGLAIPLVFVSSTRGEEFAVAAMKHGAADYLLRDQVHQLGRRVREVLSSRHKRSAEHCAGASSEVNGRKVAEENHARLAAILEATPDLVATADPVGRVLYLNPAARKLLGLGAEGPREKYNIQNFHAPEGRDLLAREAIPTAMRDGVWSGENVLRHVNGRDIPVWQVILAHQSPGGVRLLSTVAHDLTDYKRLECQCRQAQKMEAVGRLAGGVAHDFNNLLTVIKGFSELVLRQLPPDDPHRVYLEQIFRAGESATMLTRQLLAFSRKQMLKPEVFSLGALVTGIEKMLGRLIGENVELSTQTAGNLRNVKADPGQFEQVVMNLVVNATDAMPGGGKVTIQTSNREVDGDWTVQHPEMPPGQYVVLSVSDTGGGMSEETLGHLFEPFFTTKDAGKGTGLGLATVYGIVKQSGGFVYATSVLGQGSCFEIFLPPADESVPVTQSGGMSWINPRGTETILLVEDQMEVRRLAREALEMSGYKILEASSPAAAMQLFGQHQVIGALVTDVVMPGMSGCQLAERLTQERPRLKVLYMSGYTDEAVLRAGVSTSAFNMLLKPFTPSQLARKVREILDR